MVSAEGDRIWGEIWELGIYFVLLLGIARAAWFGMHLFICWGWAFLGDCIFLGEDMDWCPMADFVKDLGLYCLVTSLTIYIHTQH